MSEQRYAWSDDAEGYYGDYESREAAAAAGFAESDSDKIYTAVHVAPMQPEFAWTAEDWLEQVAMQEDYSIDAAERWDRSTGEQRTELESLVRFVLGGWLDKHGLRPKFFLVDDIEDHYRTREASGTTND